MVAMRGGADAHSLGGTHYPDRCLVGIEFVVGVVVDIEQVTFLPGGLIGNVVAARAAISARAEYRPFATFDGFTACQMQRGDQRVDGA